MDRPLLSRVAIGSREMSLSPGDIGILDMALPSRTLIAPASDGGHAHHVTLPCRARCAGRSSLPRMRSAANTFGVTPPTAASYAA
jgi:hypothetical protein